MYKRQHLTGSVIVKNAVLLAYVIHWIAYIPAYVFQTEKFYDLTGSVTYLSVVWFVFLSTYQSISLNFGNLILVLLISIWTIRLGLFLFMNKNNPNRIVHIEINKTKIRFPKLSEMD